MSQPVLIDASRAADLGLRDGALNVLTVYVRAASNTYDPIVGGAAASIIAGAAAGKMRVTGLTGMTAGMVGEQLRLSGSANAANNSANNPLTNGQGFFIAAFVNSTTVDVINAGAVVTDAGPLTWSYGCANGSDAAGDGSSAAPFLTIRPAGISAASKRLIQNGSYIIIDATGAGKCVASGEWCLPAFVNGTVAVAHPAPPSVVFQALSGVNIYAKESVIDTIALADIAAIVASNPLGSGTTAIPITGTTVGYQIPPSTTVATDPGTTGMTLNVGSTVGFDDAGALYVESASAGVYEQVDYTSKDATNFFGVTRTQRGSANAIHVAGKAVYQPRCLRIENEIVDYLVIPDTTNFGTVAAPCRRGSRGTTAASHAQNAPVYQTDFAHGLLTIVTGTKSYLALSGSAASLVTGAPAGKMRVTGVSGMTSVMVGAPFDISGAATAASNRHFLITDVISATEVYVQLRNDVVTLPDANNGTISWGAQQHKSRLLLGATGGQVGSIESHTGGVGSAIGSTYAGAPPTLPFTIATPSAEYNRNDTSARPFAINMNTATLNLGLFGLDLTHDFAGASANASLEVTVAGGVNPNGCRFDMHFNNVRSIFTFITGCVFRRNLRTAGSLQGGNNTRVHCYDATLQQGAALAPYNWNGVVFERCNSVGSGGDGAFPRAGAGGCSIGNGWIRKGRSDGFLAQIPAISTLTNVRIDECTGAAIKITSECGVVCSSVRTSKLSTRYGIEGQNGGKIQVDADCAALAGTLGDMKADLNATRLWTQFFSQAPIGKEQDTTGNGTTVYTAASTARAAITVDLPAIKVAAFTADIGVLHRYDPTGGAFAATLPKVSAVNKGQAVKLKNSAGSTNAVTLTPAAGDTIDGAATFTMNQALESVALVSDGGTNWMVM